MSIAVENQACTCHYCTDGPVAPYRHYYREGEWGPDTDRAAWLEAARHTGGYRTRWIGANVSYVDGEGYSANVWAWSGKAEDGRQEQERRMGIATTGALDTRAEAVQFVFDLAQELNVKFIVTRVN